MNDSDKNDTLLRDNALSVVLADLLREQKKRRFIDTFFRLIYLGGGVLFMLLFFSGVALIGAQDIDVESHASGRHTALVVMEGTIDEGLFERNDIMGALKKAFKSNDSVGVILKINSPGGSPVIADELYTDITALKKKYPKKPFFVVTGDICASGGYYVAVAGDKVFVNPSSIVGSIGVIHMGFGVKELMSKLGVNPRIITAGDRKSILNPFEELKPEDVEHLKKLMASIHERFIAVVKEGRGDKLKSQAVFNGLFWNGSEAINLGLADKLGTVQSVAREEVGEEKVVVYESAQFDFGKLARLSISEGVTSAVQSLINQSRTGAVKGFSLLP